MFLGHFELGSLVFALTAGADLADRPDALRLGPLLAEARARNPEIRAADARVLSMRERPVQEGTLPDPMVGLRYHDERSDRITSGNSDFSFVELAAEQPIPFPGKLDLTSAIAELEANRERGMRDATL